MQPVKASGWLNSDLTEQEKEKLLMAGIVPVNDVFFPLWPNKNKINLLYGGYGSGKSVFIQTLFLHLCRLPEYFKGYYGRKVLEDVRGSVHSKFITLIKQYKLESEFHYSEQNNGTMIITHRKTGNKLIPFGSSKADSLKSIDDPTHFFLEEMDQFTLEDFGVIISRLRTPRALTQLYGAFNTSKVFPGHWILNAFFQTGEGTSEKQQEVYDMIASSSVNSTFCNYTDNYFIDQDAYFVNLKIAAAGDEQLLRATANGEWGAFKPVNPFCINYDPEKHTSRSVRFRPQTPIIFIVDFNIDPFAINMAHVWRDEKGEHVHVFDEFSIDAGSIPKFCDKIKSVYGPYLHNCYFTGDAMGKRREISQRNHSSLYQQIQRLLSLNSKQLRLPSNPTHENSRTDVNYFLYHFPDFKIHPDKCPHTCTDMRQVECDNFGHIIKRDRTNLAQRADHLDNMRYLVNTFLKGWIKAHQKIKRS